VTTYRGSCSWAPKGPVIATPLWPEPLTGLTLRTLDDHHELGRRAEIDRHHLTETDDAGDPQLLDRFEVWEPTIHIYGDHLFVTGFTPFPEGSVRDGERRTDWNAPLVFHRVRWTLMVE
jgi:hypothetical protein